MRFLSRQFLTSLVFSVAVSLSHGAIAQDKKTLLIAEPPHGTGNLPIYVAITKGFFADEGFDVKMLTTDGGSTHTNAVLSGQAFAFIGGPEHNAFAKLRGADLRAVVNISDRSTVYFVAKKGRGPAPGQSMPAYMKGKAIAVAPYGSTPNSIVLYLLAKWGLGPKTDVIINEMSTAVVLAGLKFGDSTVGVAQEPFVTRGVREGVWDEPFLNVPNELGPYVWTTLNVRLATIKDEPETVRKFVKAVIRGLKFTQENRQEVALVAKKEFPTMSEEDLKATLDRSYADEAWSIDGTVSSQSWDTASKVVLGAGILKRPVPYDDVVDMQFVRALKPASGQ
jgi:NitT/TauT family transport system substrate-binding protein